MEEKLFFVFSFTLESVLFLTGYSIIIITQKYIYYCNLKGKPSAWQELKRSWDIFFMFLRAFARSFIDPGLWCNDALSVNKRFVAPRRQTGEILSGTVITEVYHVLTFTGSFTGLHPQLVDPLWAFSFLYSKVNSPLLYPPAAPDAGHFNDHDMRLLLVANQSGTNTVRHTCPPLKGHLTKVLCGLMLVWSAWDLIHFTWKVKFGRLFLANRLDLAQMLLFDLVIWNACSWDIPDVFQ